MPAYESGQGGYSDCGQAFLAIEATGKNNIE